MILYAAIFLLAIVLLPAMIHQLRLRNEQKRIRANGMLVSVDGYTMHVYKEGVLRSNTPAIVVMSGNGIPSPVYNYKKLYSQLSGLTRVVVPERLGYGYSDIADAPRDTKTILAQTRKALQLSGEKPPYILMPHSMSGIEALLWAMTYPDEISAIVGLDMALPAHYKDMNAPVGTVWYKAFVGMFRFLGLQRLTAMQKTAGIYDRDDLPKDEWRQEKYLIHKMMLNDLIHKEVSAILENPDAVNQLTPPVVPMLLFDGLSAIKNGRRLLAMRSWLS